MHDPRIGRFFAIDPLAASYPHYTPYQFSGNKVISHVELEGLEEAPSGSGSTMTNPTSENTDVSSTNVSDRKRARARKRMLLSRGKYKSSQFDAKRRSASSYDKGRELVKAKRGPKLSTRQFVRLYENNGWGSHDLAVTTNDYYDQALLEKSWGDPIDDIRFYVTSAVAVGASLGFVIAAAPAVAATVSEGYYATGYAYAQFEIVVTEATTFTMANYAGGTAAVVTGELALEYYGAGGVLSKGPAKGGTPKRPYLRKSTINSVWDLNKNSAGQVIDPSGAPITWNKSAARGGQWDMGHTPGNEYWRDWSRYKGGFVSWDQMKARYNDASRYRPELPSTNRGHAYEEP